MLEILAKIKGKLIKASKTKQIFRLRRAKRAKKELKYQYFNVFMRKFYFEVARRAKIFWGCFNRPKGGIFLRCFKPPEGRLFFYVFGKPKKNTASYGYVVNRILAP